MAAVRPLSSYRQPGPVLLAVAAVFCEVGANRVQLNVTGRVKLKRRFRGKRDGWGVGRKVECKEGRAGEAERAVIDAEGSGMRLQLLTCTESVEGQLGKHQRPVSAVERKTVDSEARNVQFRDTLIILLILRETEMNS